MSVENSQVSIESASGETLLELLHSSENLPTVPAVAVKILELCKDPNADFAELASVISADTAMTAKILRIANSSLFGGRSKITSVQQALVRLGLKVTRMTALGFSLAGEMETKAPATFDMDYFWRHTLTTAAAARAFCEVIKASRRDEAFAAGLLQDVGVLALHCVMPERYSLVLSELKKSPTTDLHIVEMKLLGITHMEVGSDLLRSWEVPEEVCEPVFFHHCPLIAAENQASPETLEMAWILCLAAATARLFCDPAKGITHQIVEDMADRHFGLSQETTGKILAKVDGSIREVADLFNVDANPDSNYADIKTQAALELSRLAVEAQIDSEESHRRMHKLEENVEALREQATADSLTGIFNHRALMEGLDGELSRCRRSGGRLGVLFIDIDHFKKVNDTYGHPVGDVILQKTAKFLEESLRQSDLVGRYGGEEFVAVLADPDDLQAALLVAERLRLSIAEVSKEWVKEADGITVSIGAVCTGESLSGLDGSLLIEAADQCLYAAKEAGRNCTRYSTL